MAHVYQVLGIFVKRWPLLVASGEISKKRCVYLLNKDSHQRPYVPMISIDISIFLREKKKEKKEKMIIPYAMKPQISQ